jgi:hypothetical protein
MTSTRHRAPGSLSDRPGATDSTPLALLYFGHVVAGSFRFIEPCLPTSADKPPTGPDWVMRSRCLPPDGRCDPIAIAFGFSHGRVPFPPATRPTGRVSGCGIRSRLSRRQLTPLVASYNCLEGGPNEGRFKHPRCCKRRAGATGAIRSGYGRNRTTGPGPNSDGQRIFQVSGLHVSHRKGVQSLHAPELV